MVNSVFFLPPFDICLINRAHFVNRPGAIFYIVEVVNYRSLFLVAIFETFNTE